MFIIEKYVKIRLKNRGPPCYFLEVRRPKILQKLKYRVYFCNILFLAQNLSYTVNINICVWFIFWTRSFVNFVFGSFFWTRSSVNFVFGSFFEQDHLLNLFILRAYAKRWPKCALISKQKLRIIHWEKKYGCTGLVSEKMEAFYAELNETKAAAPSSYSATGAFLRYIYFVLVAKNYQKIRSRCLAHEFSLTDIF